MVLLMFFQLKTASQRLGIRGFLEENQKLAQVWTTTDFFFLLQSDHVFTVCILRSECHCGSFPTLRPEFHSKGKVNVPRSGEYPGIVLTGSWEVARMSTWKQGLQMSSRGTLIWSTFCPFHPTSWFNMQGLSFWSFLKVLYLTVYLYLCLLVWHLLPPEPKQTWDVMPVSHMLEKDTSFQ